MSWGAYWSCNYRVFRNSKNKMVFHINVLNSVAIWSIFLEHIGVWGHHKALSYKFYLNRCGSLMKNTILTEIRVTWTLVLAPTEVICLEPTLHGETDPLPCLWLQRSSDDTNGECSRSRSRSRRLRRQGRKHSIPETSFRGIQLVIAFYIW